MWLLLFEQGRIQLSRISPIFFYLHATPDIWTRTDLIIFYLHVHSWYLNQERVQYCCIFMYTPDIWTRTDPVIFYLHVHSWYLNQDGSNYVVSSCTLLIFESERVQSFYNFWYSELVFMPPNSRFYTLFFHNNINITLFCNPIQILTRNNSSLW